MTTAIFIVIYARAKWWIDLNGKAKGPFLSRESAELEAINLASNFAREGRRAEVQVAENIRQKQAGNEKVTEFDLNKDKKTDVWTYTVTATNADGKEYERLARKDLDINWDGKVDIARIYDEVKQRPVYVVADLANFPAANPQEVLT